MFAERGRIVLDREAAEYIAEELPAHDGFTRDLRRAIHQAWPEPLVPEPDVRCDCGHLRADHSQLSTGCYAKGCTTCSGYTPCRGFHWIGQPFTSCDNCGRPWDAHEGYWRAKRGSGPFDPTGLELVPWPEEGPT